MSDPETMTMDIDEKYYLLASRHLESDRRSEALWTKALTLAGGDQDKARYRYIALMVERLAVRDGRRGGPPGHVGSTNDTGDGAFDDPRLRADADARGLDAPLDLSLMAGEAGPSGRLAAPDWPLLDPDDGGPGLRRSDAIALGASTVQLIYYFYLVGLFALGVPLLIGVVVAYLQDGDDLPGWLRTHQRFLILLFWVGLAMAVLAIVIGFLSVPAALAFVIIVSMALVVALARGLHGLRQGEPAPYPLRQGRG